jgi:hypothetical protein
VKNIGSVLLGLCLSSMTIAIGLLLSAEQIQAKELIFHGGRDGESLSWYLLKKTAIAPATGKPVKTKVN